MNIIYVCDDWSVDTHNSISEMPSNDATVTRDADTTPNSIVNGGFTDVINLSPLPHEKRATSIRIDWGTPCLYHCLRCGEITDNTCYC